MSGTTPDAEVPSLPDLAAIVQVLNRHRVAYVLIGGSAAQFSVPSLVTYDVDLSPATDQGNLQRLSAALDELSARIRTEAVPEGLSFHHDGASLGRSKMWNLQCAHGLLHIALEPAGGGYDHLAQRARVVTVRGVEIPSPTWPTSSPPRGSPIGPRTNLSSPSLNRPSPTVAPR